jgi:methylmalonyl-CoA mutase
MADNDLDDQTLRDLLETALGAERASEVLPLRGTERAPMAWHTHHGDADPERTRLAVSDAVAAGAHGVTLQLAAPGFSGLPMRYDAIAHALAGIDFAEIAVTLAAGDQYVGALQCLTALWDAQSVPKPARWGGAPADPLGTLAATGALEAELWPTLDIMGSIVANVLDDAPNATRCLADGRVYHEAGAGAVLELAAMLATLAEYRRTLEVEGLKPEYVFASLTVGLSISAECDLSMAKLHAARQLTEQLTDGQRLPIHVTSSARMFRASPPATRLWLNARAAVAIAQVDADCAVLLPHSWANGQTDVAAQRVALHLLAQATTLPSVSRSLTAAAHMAAAAWSEFERIEADGGLARMLMAGTFQQRVALDAQRQDGPVAQYAAPPWLAELDLPPSQPMTASPPRTPITDAQTRTIPVGNDRG